MRSKWNNPYRVLLAHSGYLSLIPVLLMRSIINSDRKIGRKIGKLSNKYGIYCLFLLYFNVFAHLTFGFFRINKHL